MPDVGAGAEGDPHGRVRPSERAAAATRRLARTASHMPRKPIRPEKTAPTRKAIEREILSVHSPKPASPCTGSSKSRKKATTAKTARVRNWRAR